MQTEKYCVDCGRLIAVRPEWNTHQRGGRYNALRYCPDCAAVRTARNKATWQKENRRDCRAANKALRRQAVALNNACSALEERVALLSAENAELRSTRAQYLRNVERQQNADRNPLSFLLGGRKRN